MSSEEGGASFSFGVPTGLPSALWERQLCDAVLYEVRSRTTLLSLSRPRRPGAVFAVVVNAVCPCWLVCPWLTR